MNEETMEVLLQEFCDFRADISERRQDIGERVATVEAVVRPAIQGNGQPSRLTRAEEQIRELEHRRWKHDGMVAGLWVAATAAWEFIKYKMTGHI